MGIEFRRFGNEDTLDGIFVFQRSSEILELLRGFGFDNTENHNTKMVASECTPYTKKSPWKRRKLLSQMSQNIHKVLKRGESQEVITIIDDDGDNDGEDHDEFSTRGSKNVSSPVNPRPSIPLKSSKGSIVNQTLTKDNRQNHLPDSTQLDVRQKWAFCAMWRKNYSISEIAAAINVSEDVLHTYIYGLIKRDATNSGPVNKASEMILARKVLELVKILKYVDE